MATYVALLRGINVGRAKQVSMADLAAAFESCSCTAVRTVVRSGNVVFESASALDGSTAEVLEAELLRRTGVASSMVLLPGSEVQRIARENPLLEIGTDPSRLMVGFVSQPPATGGAPSAATLAPEVLVVGERAVYQWCPDGVSASRVPPSFWRQVAPVVTVRNWRTVTRLLELLPPGGTQGWRRGPG